MVLWAGWSVVLCATLVAHPVSLTTLRLGAPAAPVVTVAAGLAGEASALALASGLIAALLAALLALTPETASHFVNGPAYPNERRFPLRTPTALLAGPLALAWVLAVGIPVAGVLLLAAGRPVAGAVVLVVGVPVSAVLVRALHGLSRRWVVFVPAGVVLHDPMTLLDPVLFRRQSIRSLAPGRRGGDVLDLTQRAAGLTLEVALLDEVTLNLVKPGSRGGRRVSARRLLVAPARPGAVLEEARARRVGTTPAKPKGDG